MKYLEFVASCLFVEDLSLRIALLDFHSQNDENRISRMRGRGKDRLFTQVCRSGFGCSDFDRSGFGGSGIAGSGFGGSGFGGFRIAGAWLGTIFGGRVLTVGITTIPSEGLFFGSPAASN